MEQLLQMEQLQGVFGKGWSIKEECRDMHLATWKKPCCLSVFLIVLLFIFLDVGTLYCFFIL